MLEIMIGIIGFMGFEGEGGGGDGDGEREALGTRWDLGKQLCD